MTLNLEILVLFCSQKPFFPAAIFTFDFWGCIGKAVIKI